MSDQSASQAHACDFPAPPSPVFGFGAARGDSSYPGLPACVPPYEAGRTEVPLDEVGFSRLTASCDIAEIHHLRAEIQLPASAVADPGFRAREKKETRKASWARSSGAMRSSAP